MEAEQLKRVVEAALMVTETPLSLERMQSMFQDEEEPPTRDKLRRVLEELEVDYENTGLELALVASGYRFQARAEVAPWVNRLFDERRPKYSRALLETIAIIAYRQPITRGEIENIRGVAVSTNIIRTLLEREWVRIVGHRDVPGRPSVYATTKGFLDYFNLASLDQLPSLAELKDFDEVNPDLFKDVEREATETDGQAKPSAASGDEAAAEQAAGDEAEGTVRPTVKTLPESDAHTGAVEASASDEMDEHSDVIPITASTKR